MLIHGANQIENKGNQIRTMAQASIQKNEKAEIIKTYGGKGNNTGSSEVQVALLTRRINQLNEHFKINRLDHHSRRGLLKLVGQRKRLLHYLRDKDAPAYAKLIQSLGLRK